MNRSLNVRPLITRPSSREVRLVELLRPLQPRNHAVQRPMLALEWRKFTLEQLPHTPCSALSYTWGDAKGPNDVQRVYISDGQRFQSMWIRNNVYEFLCNMARLEKYGIYFIDALCIDQLNDENKGQEINFMGAIYTNANRTLIWFPSPGFTDPDRVLRHILIDKYWSRVWIVQEVMLARAIEVFCGPFRFTWQYLTNLIPGTLPAAFEGENDYLNRADGIVPTSTIEQLQRMSPYKWSPSALKVIDFKIKWEDKHGIPNGYESLSDGGKFLSLNSVGFNPDSRRVRDHGITLYMLYNHFGGQQCSVGKDILFGFIELLRPQDRAQLQGLWGLPLVFIFLSVLMMANESLWADTNYTFPRVQVFPGDREYEQVVQGRELCDTIFASFLPGLRENAEEGVARQMVQETKNELSRQWQLSKADTLQGQHFDILDLYARCLAYIYYDGNWKNWKKNTVIS